MKNPKWSHVTIALAVIAALAIASPAIGVSKSIRKAIKKEVSKQISKATGPAGSAGSAGSAGAPGANGTARAYARVDSHSDTPCAPNCDVLMSKGVSKVTHPAIGQYCVYADGIDARSVSAVVAVDLFGTAVPMGNGSAMVYSYCIGTNGAFEVNTERQPVTTVRDAAGTGTTTVAGNAVPADTVGFTIVIP